MPGANKQPESSQKKNAYLQLAWQNIRNIFKFPRRQQVPGQQQQEQQQQEQEQQGPLSTPGTRESVNLLSAMRVQAASWHTHTPAQQANRQQIHTHTHIQVESVCKSKLLSGQKCLPMRTIECHISSLLYMQKTAARGKGGSRERVTPHVRDKFWARVVATSQNFLAGNFPFIFFSFALLPLPSSAMPSCYHCCVSKSQWRNETLPTTRSSSNANVYAAMGLT